MKENQINFQLNLHMYNEIYLNMTIGSSYKYHNHVLLVTKIAIYYNQ